MTRDGIGEFERLVMMAVLHLGEDAYGAAIIDELERRAGREASSGAVYVALRRLEEKRMLRSDLGEPTPQRGGRPRRFFRATETGLEALRHARAEWEAMLGGLEGVLDPGG